MKFKLMSYGVSNLRFGTALQHNSLQCTKIQLLSQW